MSALSRRDTASDVPVTADVTRQKRFTVISNPEAGADDSGVRPVTYAEPSAAPPPPADAEQFWQDARSSPPEAPQVEAAPVEGTELGAGVAPATPAALGAAPPQHGHAAAEPAALPLPPKPRTRVGTATRIADRLHRAFRAVALWGVQLLFGFSAVAAVTLCIWMRVSSEPVPYAWAAPYLLALTTAALACQDYGVFLLRRRQAIRTALLFEQPLPRSRRRWKGLFLSGVSAWGIFLLLHLLMTWPAISTPRDQLGARFLAMIWPPEAVIAPLVQGFVWAAIGVMLAEVAFRSTRRERKHLWPPVKKKPR